MSRGGRALLLLCWAVTALAASVCAQRSETRVRPPSGGEYDVQLHAAAASARGGGFGFARVTVHNGSDRAATFDCDLRGRFNEGRVIVSTTLRIEPGETGEVVLPLPSREYPMNLQVRPRGASGATTSMVVDSPSFDPETWTMAVVEGAGHPPANWPAALSVTVEAAARRTFSRDSTPALDQRLSAAELPPTWWMLSGFDLIVVDGRAVDLEPARQTVLRDYALAGGVLLVQAADGLPPGPLRDLVDGQPEGEAATGRVGFGSLFVLRGDDARRAPGVLPQQLGDRLTAASAGLRGQRQRAGPHPDAWFLSLEIPGLGELPRATFFVLLVLFVIAVGPVNYFLLKRRRQLVWLLVTVPGLGFGVAGLILLYGIFGEGFGTRVVRRSVTWLDQTEHLAVRSAHSEYYAGFGPGRLQPGFDTLLECDRLANGEWTRSVTLGADGSCSGEALPSRTPTTLSTTAVASQRARLRFEQREDGSYELLGDPWIEPVDEAGAVLLRDLNGDWFGRLRRGTAQLEAIDVETAERWQQRLGARLGLPVRFQESFRIERQEFDYQGTASNPAAAARPDFELRPGEYLLAVESMPGGDPLGLDSDELRSAHLVHGRAAVEDFLR